MLSFLLQATGSRCQFVLFFARLRSNIKWKFAHRRHVVNDTSQLIQLFSDRIQLFRIGRQVISVALTRLARVLYLNRLIWVIFEENKKWNLSLLKVHLNPRNVLEEKLRMEMVGNLFFCFFVTQSLSFSWKDNESFVWRLWKAWRWWNKPGKAYQSFRSPFSFILTYKDSSTHFDTTNWTIRAEDRIGDFVEMMWIFGLCLDDESLTLGTLGLHIVLPEETRVLFAAGEPWLLVVVAVVWHSYELVFVVFKVGI